MFKLTNVEDHITLSIEVAGYQFPDNPVDDWCFLKINIEQGEELFEKIDPAIEASEILDIYRWFKSLSESKLPRHAHLTFTEPCLSFDYLAYKNDCVRLSVNLSHELQPNFYIAQFKSKDSQWHIVFELNANDFIQVLSGVERTINEYPIRDKS